MGSVGISSIRSLASEASEIAAFALIEPTDGVQSGPYSLAIAGHVVATCRRPAFLELRCAGHRPVRIPNRHPRPDLGAKFPDVPWAGSNSGFRASVSLLPYPNEFVLELAMVFDDEDDLLLALIEGSHDSPPVSQTGISPIIVTTLGRTGSTWVLGLLSRHPDVVAYPPYKAEVRCSTYWTDVMTALTNPASYLQSVRTRAVGGDWWMGRARPFDVALQDDELEEWLGRAQFEAMVAFYRDRIDEFYLHLASRAGADTPRYFVEKGLPHTQLTLLRQLYPDMKEVFLVRDFRDMLASMFAYSRSKGIVAFGRQHVETDEDFVRSVVGSSVDQLLAAWRQRRHDAHLLRYEELVSRPRETLRSLLSSVEIGSSDTVIDQMLLADEQEGQRAMARAHRTTPTLNDSLRRWTRDLNPHLVTCAEEAFADALKEFGYVQELDSAEPLAASA